MNMIGRILGTSALGLGGTGYYLVNNYDEFKRPYIFWKEAFPAFLHYRYVEYKTKNEPDHIIEKEFDRLHDIYSPVAKNVTHELKGFYLKQAQLMSTVDSFVPKQYLEWCKLTQDLCPSSFDEPNGVELAIEKELGKPIDEVFSYFEHEPLGAASIGQVHKAILKDTGEVVAVKVQTPGIEKKFRSDLSTIIKFCELAMPQHLPAFEEIETQFLTEFNYLKEGENMLEIRKNMLRSTLKDEVYVPKPYLDISTERVLIMEYIDGDNIIRKIKSKLEAYAKYNNKTVKELEDEQAEKMKDPNFKYGDIFEEAEKLKKYATIIKTKDNIFNSFVYLYNQIPYIKKINYFDTPMPVNVSEVIKKISDIAAYQIFEDGSFNADPHPGNFMLFNNDDPRIGLIDFGQVKRFDNDQQRIDFAKVIVALAEGDEEEVVKIYKQNGCKTTNDRHDIIFALAKFWNDDNSEAVTGNRNIQQFMDYCEAQDPAKEVPQHFVMAARVSVLIRGFAQAFGLKIEMSKLWKEHAQKVLDDNGVVYKPKKTTVNYDPYAE